jgi:hypothetical protein
MEKETKEIKVVFDNLSLDILRKVDTIHRQSMINYAIRLVDETDVFKILSGEKDVEVSIDNKTKDVEETVETVEETKQESFIDMSDFSF